MSDCVAQPLSSLPTPTPPPPPCVDDVAPPVWPVTRAHVVCDIEAYIKVLRCASMSATTRLQVLRHAQAALSHARFAQSASASVESNARATTELECVCAILRRTAQLAGSQCAETAVSHVRLAVDAMLVAASLKRLACATGHTNMSPCAETIGRAAALCERIGEMTRAGQLYALSADLYDADGDWNAAHRQQMRADEAMASGADNRLW